LGPQSRRRALDAASPWTYQLSFFAQYLRHYLDHGGLPLRFATMVTEQKGRIARLKATGVDTALAELTLRALEANLKRFQNHADWSERKGTESARTVSGHRSGA
jgi:hypothetical protein